MDALRRERDVLQSELMKRQQQLKLERHLMREKCEIEKEMLIKSWQEKVSAASLNAAASEKSASQPTGKSIINATADAMVCTSFLLLFAVKVVSLRLDDRDCARRPV